MGGNKLSKGGEGFGGEGWGCWDHTFGPHSSVLNIELLIITHQMLNVRMIFTIVGFLPNIAGKLLYWCV